MKKIDVKRHKIVQLFFSHIKLDTLNYIQKFLRMRSDNMAKYHCQIAQNIIMPRPHRAEALSDDARLTSNDVCLSVVYIGPKSRTKGHRKTEIGTDVAHVTRDSDTTFKVKRSKVNLQGAGTYCGGLPHSLLLLWHIESLRMINDDRRFWIRSITCTK